MRGIHRGPVNSPHKWPVTRKMFPFDDAIMLSIGIHRLASCRAWYCNANIQIDIHRASLCVLLMLEILCSNTKLTCADVVCMVCFRSVWLCFICASFEFTLGSSVFTLSSRYYRAQSKLKMASNQNIVNTKNPEDTLATICWEI